MSYCFACLSSDRTLSSLDPYIEICAKLFEGVHKSLSLLRVCWECKAKLKSIQCFHNQVKKAEKIETMYHSLASKKLFSTLSRLAVSKPNLITINNDTEVEYKHEEPKKIIIEPKIKLEINEAVDLKEELISDHELMYEDCIDDIPLEHIFRKQIKKERKAKVKKQKQTKSAKINVNKIWELKKPIQVKVGLSKVKEWLEAERKSSFLRHFPYKCEDCAIGYSFRKSWMKHRSTRHNEKNPYICDLCRRSFTSVRKLDVHKLDHNNIWKCKDCGFNTMIKNHMLWHLEQEHTVDEKIINCDFCVTKFKSNRQLHIHMCNFHRDFTCDYCGYKCITKRKIFMHITSAHGPRTCNICKKTFKNNRYLRIHIKTLHTVKHDESSYCVQCDIQFDNTHLFKRHVNSSVKHKTEVRGDVPKKTYPCSECGKVYLQRYGMRNHYRLVHLKSTKYYCEECDLYLLNRTTYLRHDNKHRGIQQLKNKFCDICGRGFHTNRILINHIRTHTGERPHECPHCDAKFAQLTAMKSHVKHIHLKVERRRQFLA